MSEEQVETLSIREREVATDYVDGRTYKEIARDLGIAPATVRTHLRTVFRKLGVTSRIELAQTLDAASDLAPATARNDADLVAELSLQLDEAMRRERILARVLRIISQQGDDLHAVIDAVLDHALEICEAEFGILFEYHGDLRFRAMQSRNIAPAFAAWLTEQGIFVVDPGTGLGRVAQDLRTVNITDVRSEDIYQTAAPLRVATADLGHARSFVAIPMMWGDRLLGAFTIYRTRVHPFNDHSLELALLFADQAAIAIQNARQRRPTLEQPPEKKHTDNQLAGQGSADQLPLLAILPFRAVDEADETLRVIGRQLASSMTMELGSSPLFRVIDQASCCSPQLAHLSPMKAADLLGTKLLVSGSIRRLPEGGFRVAPVLHEAGRPAPRWAELFETRVGNTNALFESLLSRLCASIGMGVERELMGAARSRRSLNQTAMDHFLMGLELHHLNQADGFLEARRHFTLALDEDPAFGRAQAALAITFVRQWFWESSRRDLLDTAEEHARKGIIMAPQDAWAQTAFGVVSLYKRRHADAISSFGRAMELSPHDAYVVSRTALGHFYSGAFDKAIPLFERAIKLDPLHSNRQRAMLGHALFHAGRHDQAIEALAAVEDPLSWELAWLACCYWAKGELKKMKATSERYHAIAQISASHYQASTRPFQHEADLCRLETALEGAGLSKRAMPPVSGASHRENEYPKAPPQPGLD